MMDTYTSEPTENYYSAAESAQILGVSKQTIINRCQKGDLPGAHKIAPTKLNPHGQWLIPKAAIDQPVMTQDVAVLTRQINPVEFQQALAVIVQQAVADANAPLQKQIDDLKDELRSANEKLIAAVENKGSRSFFDWLFGGHK